MHLQFGLSKAIPASVATAWGARWIYPDDMLPDRQDLQGPDKSALKEWLNGGALQEARKAARRADGWRKISSSSCETVTLYRDAHGMIVGNPNGSYGYLYVAAWLHPIPVAIVPQND